MHIKTIDALVNAMTYMLNEIFSVHYKSLPTLFESIGYAAAFAFGICRYSIILVIVGILLVRFMLNIKDLDGKILKIVSAPLFIVALYFDYNNGPLQHYFFEHSIILTIMLTYLLVELFRFTGSFMVVKITDHKIFKLCPLCNYENKKLVNTCNACNKSMSDCSDKIPAEIDFIPYAYNKNELDEILRLGLTNQVSRRVMSMINVDTNEKLVLSMTLSTLRSFNKNGEKKRLTQVVLTNNKIILLDFRFYNRGWSYREYIPIESISSIMLCDKKINTVKMPVLTIGAKNNDIYELYYNTLFKSNEKLKKVIEAIEVERKVK